MRVIVVMRVDLPIMDTRHTNFYKIGFCQAIATRESPYLA